MRLTLGHGLKPVDVTPLQARIDEGLVGVYIKMNIIPNEDNEH